jgi:hypothetical protein
MPSWTVAAAHMEGAVLNARNERTCPRNRRRICTGVVYRRRRAQRKCQRAEQGPGGGAPRCAVYSIPMRGGWLYGMRIVVLVTAVAGFVACAAMEQAEKRDQRTFSAEHLGEPDVEAEMIADSLDEPERTAARDAGIPVEKRTPGSDDLADATGAPHDGGQPEGDPDKAGKIGMAILSVSVTLGMLAAPFFLY